MIFNKKALTVSIACILSAPVYQANAALIDLNITGSASSVAGSATDSAVDASATNMNASSSAYDNNNYSAANSKGDASGWFYSTSSGNQNFMTESIVTQTYNVTNDSNTDQFFDFSFEVMNGSIDASCGDSGYGYGDDTGYGNDTGYGSGGCTGNNFSKAGYLAEILLNGSSLWNSQAEVKVDSTGQDLTSSGAVFDNTYSSGNGLYWGSSLFNIDLGLIAANDTFTLEYNVKTWVEGSILESSNEYNNAYAQFGDPNGFGSSGNPNVIGSQVTSVSEPGSLALIGLGLFGLGFVRKHKKLAK